MNMLIPQRRRKKYSQFHDSGSEASYQRTPRGDLPRVTESESAAAVDDIPVYVQMEPRGDVYSYFMFTGPVEAFKTGFSVPMCGAWFLLFLTTFLKGIVLYIIFTHSTLSDVQWQETVVGPSSIFNGPGPHGKCAGAKSLCRPGINGSISCAPPSVRLAGANLADWDELDLDGDGVWTYKEAEKAEDDMRCKYHVSLTEVFNAFVQMALNHEDVLYMSPELKDGTAIAKPYFEFAAGDVIMCGYRNADMCPNLLQRGIFDGPLANGTSPRVGTSLTSAMDYCYGLLQDGGICEKTLPSTYSTWRRESEQQCLGSSYTSFTFVHPTKENQHKSYLAVGYDAYYLYSKGGSWGFLIYKTFLVGLFVLALYSEARELATDISWLRRFPDVSEVGEPVTYEVDEEFPEQGPKPVRINGITRKIRMVSGFLVFSRFVVIMILTLVGLMFLLKETDELDLLLNSIGLIFVIEFAALLYMYILSPEMQTKHELMEPMKVEIKNPGYLARRPALNDWVGFGILCAAMCVLIFFYYQFMLAPVFNSVNCTCLSQGAKCQEAEEFSNDFWKNYWAVTVPQVFEDVDKMKLYQTKVTTGFKVQNADMTAMAILPTVVNASAAISDFSLKGAESQHARKHRRAREHNGLHRSR